MNDRSGDQLDAAARYLATGDPAGLDGDATRQRLDRTLALLTERCTWEQPSPGLFAAIVARVDRIEQAEGVQRAGRIDRPRQVRQVRRRPGWLMDAAAAAVLAAVGAVATVAVRASPPGTDEPELALVGTDLAPDASGAATLRATPAGVAVTLRVDGLDPAPRRAYYEAWMKGPRGTVAIGTFHVREGYDEPIELWSGVDPAAYPEITVTLEPEDGNPASSGRKVLGTDG